MGFVEAYECMTIKANATQGNSVRRASWPPRRHCQRKVSRAEFSTEDRKLGRRELTPLGEPGAETPGGGDGDGAKAREASLLGVSHQSSVRSAICEFTVALPRSSS